MTRTRKPKTDTTDSREDRLGAALRANLARRKAQARARAERKEGETDSDNAPESEE
ncbi:hypothetical protein SAMN05421538_10471 [Paracoccus isoporae]|uniref:Uncharacterized protein n=1 Tax=Paracoccus isoporae TaxID=591205 RepID=A0A1G7A966_9RHOB|nr:hypothetical protein [Paracoccus isoporae]SDE11488.1 hypothetical protein SAMN05421538_10471 [Paracoccus isoporae]